MGLPAIDVKNIALVIADPLGAPSERQKSAHARIVNYAVNTSASARQMGNTIPPARAVTLGSVGARIKSVAMSP